MFWLAIKREKFQYTIASEREEKAVKRKHPSLFLAVNFW
jgi:hypothetical protein